MENDKSSVKNEISAIDITATVRPSRLAFLIDEQTSFSWILDELLPWVSTVWGGATYFFFPVSKDLMNDPKADPWLKLLQKFDPDQVVSTAAFPQSFLDVISANLLTHAKIFQFSSGAVSLPQMSNRGRFYTIPFEELFSTQEQRTKIMELNLTGSTIHDLWFFSLYGRLGKYINVMSGSPKHIWINVDGSLTKAQIEQNCADIAKFRFPTTFEDAPMQRTLQFLGARGANDVIVDFFYPYVVIIGETLADWCLFQTLHCFYPGVRWFPTSLLLSNGATVPSGFDFYLNSVLTDTDREFSPIATSASLDEMSIREIIDASLARVRGTITGLRNTRYDVQVDFSSPVENWFEWGESNNFKEESILFQGETSIPRVPLLSPKKFRLGPGKSKFVIDLHTFSYKYLGHHMVDEVPIKWPNQKANIKADAKRSFNGGISFNPVSHLTISGQELESTLNGPRLIKRKLFDDFTSILSKSQLIPVKTIGSMNISSVLRMWDGSIESFFQDYYEFDRSKVFSAFKLGEKARKDRSLGLTEKCGITLRRKILLSYPLASGFTPSLNDLSNDVLDRWIENGILVRGEKLTCLTCGWVDFYSESEIHRQFKCHRCSNFHFRNLLSMGRIEPAPLYDLSPLVYGLQESNSDLVIFGAKKLKEEVKSYAEFEYEISVHNQNGKSIQEIDLIANIDGRLAIAECKSNGTLNGQQLEKYVSFCRSYNVQEFICVSNGKWSNQAQAHINAAFASLKYIKVRFF